MPRIVDYIPGATLNVDLTPRGWQYYGYKEPEKDQEIADMIRSYLSLAKSYTIGVDGVSVSMVVPADLDVRELHSSVLLARSEIDRLLKSWRAVLYSETA